MAPLSAYLTSALTLHPRSPPKPPQDPNYKPGAGTIDPKHVNNHAFFALFALVGVFFVLGGIWFFFWAKNGGFHFRKGDWEEYKSTVLRRKGPNGTTLSGATKTTRLGGGSVVASGGEEVLEKGVWNNKGKKRGKKNNEDRDMRAYRQEKPARVGGLNRESDGIFSQDFAATESTMYSDEVSEPPSSAFGGGGGHVQINTPKAQVKDSRWARRTAAAVVAQPTTPSPKKNVRNGFYNQTPGSNTSTDSHRPLRPNAQSPAGTSTPSRSRQTSPTKAGGAYAGSRGSGMGGGGRDYTEPLDWESRYSGTASEGGGTEDSRGTKAYFHPIPGLGGKGGAGGGFRRGRGRRDSLSDSEGETMAS